MYSIWAEFASPLKTSFRNLFQEFAMEVYEKHGKILTSYVPSDMGGSMPLSDYLTYMKEDELPQCYVTMSFGECSHPGFIKRLLDTDIYQEPEIFGYFPEVMVIDHRRLGERPIPHHYEQLCNPEYYKELCLIGSPKIPDPVASYYIFKKYGLSEMERFIRNIRGFASPVDTIRHIGKSSNRFGSVFIMPSLFAAVCIGKPNVSIIIPESGAIAEPFICMHHKHASDYEYVRSFLFSKCVKKLLEQNNFTSVTSDNIAIDPLCEQCIYPELDQIYQMTKSILRT